MAYQFVENSGSAAPANNALYLYGSPSSGVYTVGSNNIVTLAVYDWTTAQKEVGLLATTSSATTGTETTTAVTPQGLSTKLGVQTLYTLPVSQGSASPFTWRGPLTNGQLLIGSSNNFPVAATLTPGTGISITNGAAGIILTLLGISKIVKNVFTYTGARGTYTPTANMIYCDVEVVGGGGGSGGASNTQDVTASVAGGGGGGGYAKKLFAAATIGASQSFTVGGGGTGGSAGNNPGNTGGTTTFGVAPLLYATGGSGSDGCTHAIAVAKSGAAGGIGYLGDINAVGGGGACQFWDI